MEKTGNPTVLREAVLGQTPAVNEADIFPLSVQPPAGIEPANAVTHKEPVRSTSGVPADSLLVHPGLQTVAETHSQVLNPNPSQPAAGNTLEEPKLHIMSAAADSDRQPAIESQAGLQPQSLAVEQSAARIQAAGDSHVFRLQTSTADPAVYVMSEHGAAASRWELARLEKGITEPAVLIHFDAHADLEPGEAFAPPAASATEALEKEYGIMSFIAPAVANGAVSEIYWVVPDFRRPDFGDQRLDMTYYAAEIVHVDSEGRPLVDSEDRVQKTVFFSQQYPDESNAATLSYDPFGFWPSQSQGVRIENVRSVTVHRVYASQLPDFSRDIRPLALDIDEDYFWMNTVDGQTALPREGRNGGTFEDRLQQDVQSALNAVNRRYVDPFVITVAISPGCTPDELTGTLTTDIIRSLPASGLIAAETATDTLDEYSRL